MADLLIYRNIIAQHNKKVNSTAKCGLCQVKVGSGSQNGENTQSQKDKSVKCLEAKIAFMKEGAF